MRTEESRPGDRAASRVVDVSSISQANDRGVPTPTPEPARLLAAALWYAGQGLAVHPLKPWAKTPLLNKWPERATTDADQIREWWARWPNANVAVVTGGLVDVADLDGPEAVQRARDLLGGTLPPSLGFVTTPTKRGAHAYLPATGRPNSANLAPGIDWRGAGGYVVAPPSVVRWDADADAGREAGAGRYEWAEALDLAGDATAGPWLPLWAVKDADAIQRPAERRETVTAPPNGAGRQWGAWAARALDNEATEVAAAQPGARNDTLNRAAFRVGQVLHTLDRAEAELVLADAARACGLPDTEATKTIASGLDAGAREPRYPKQKAHPTGAGGTRARTGREPEDTPPDTHAEGEHLERTPDAIDTATGEILDAPTLAARVFGATPALSAIRQAAHSRLVVPWAVLGAVLARVVAETPPHVVLPPIVGSDASLNLAVALVAASGGGKSGATACADDLLHVTPYRLADVIGPGSGEGVMMAFLEWDADEKRNRLKSHAHALMHADEIGQIGAVQGRASQSSLGSILRSMLTGDRVGTTAADTTRKRQLPAHGYRLAVVAGVQPALSDVLLADADAGTPQRWLWLPADDPDWQPPEETWPERLDWRLPALDRGRDTSTGRVRLDVCPEAVQTVRDTRHATIRGDADHLDGHRLLTRLKVGAALALLHGELEVSPQWWALAGLVMHRSDLTRARCQTELAAKVLDESRAAGRRDHAREVGHREARDADATMHARAIWRGTVGHRGTLKGEPHPNAKHGQGKGCTRRCIAWALRNHPGADRDAAIETALGLGWLEEREGRFWAGPSQPAGGGR